MNYFLILLVVLPYLVYLINKDYNVFLSLGPGGTPHNFCGYVTVTFLRLIALRSPQNPGLIPTELIGGGSLKHLPKRNSPRPSVIGIAPHRQTNQRPSEELKSLLSTSIVNLADAHPKRLLIAKSCFEKHCAALFSSKVVNKTCNGEVAHAHPSDGSLHMTLHPEDAKVVIEAGWGERHPLARGGYFSRFVPAGFLMVYAPCTKEEVEVVMSIVLAGILWVSGEPLDKVDDDT